MLDRKTGAEFSRTAPAHKTGVAEAVPPPSGSEGALSALVGGFEKGLDALSKAIGTYATQREDAAFSEVLRKTLEEAAKETIKSEAVALVEKAPLGKAILLTIRLSDAFADGIGKAIIEVNQQTLKDQEAAFARLPAELDEQAVRDINRLFRGYHARGTEQLPGVLGAGIVAVADQAVQELFRLGAKLSDRVVKDAVGQLARQLLKQSDPIALFSQAVREAVDSIPAGRRRVEGLAFSFAATTFIRQLSDERLRTRLKGIQPLINAVGSEEKIDVAMLASIIQLIVDRSFELYAKAVDVAGAGQEVRNALVEQARVLIKKTGIRIELASGNSVFASLTSITVPADFEAELKQPPGGPTAELRNRFVRRILEYDAFVEGLRATLDGRAAAAQLRVDRLNAESARRVARDQPPIDVDRERAKLQNALASDANAARTKAQQLRDLIVREFGQSFQGGTITLMLDLTIDRLLHPSEVPRRLVDRPVK